MIEYHVDPEHPCGGLFCGCFHIVFFLCPVMPRTGAANLNTSEEKTVLIDCM